MRVSKEEAVRHRAHVVRVAAAAFREHGFRGIGVVDLMREAGLTHGAFYGQFDSKEELEAEASESALATTLAALEERAANSRPRSAFAGIVDSYLSMRHRNAPEQGCAFAALGAEAGRSDRRIRARFTKGVHAHLKLFAAIVPGRSAAARRDRAIPALATLVGAMILARAVDDSALSREILASAARSLKEQYSGHGEHASAPRHARARKASSRVGAQ